VKALRGLAVGTVIVLLFIPAARAAIITGVGVGVAFIVGGLIAAVALTGGRRRR